MNLFENKKEMCSNSTAFGYDLILKCYIENHLKTEPIISFFKRQT